ncbi:MAG: molybdenum cofactor guanylyltransferase [Methanomicrobiales archaeon]|nr:molybdenum cofactor guanylyltransferase [Methanomicrobiales archaeon]
MRSSLILVGGEARRADGMEKYFFSLGGQTFIDRLVGTLHTVTDEVVLVARNPDQCRRFREVPQIRCVADIRRGIGPVGGLHAGIQAVQGDVVFVCACDMPCVEAHAVSLLFSSIGTYDAVIPCWDKEKIEPLHAVYQKEPLRHLLEEISCHSLRALVTHLNVRYLNVGAFRADDPDLQTFTNINRLEDLAAVSGVRGRSAIEEPADRDEREGSTAGVFGQVRTGAAD